MRRLALIACVAAAAAGCKRERDRAAGEAEARPADPESVRRACRRAADAYVNDGDGAALIAACAPMIGDAGCRRAVTAAGRAGEARAGLAAIERCAERYCPKHAQEELCELESPAARQLESTFPRLLGEALRAEHGEALGTLDGVAYLFTRALLPPERQLYIRIPAPLPGAEEVEVGAGKKGWMGCHIETRWTVPLALEAGASDLAPRLGALVAGVEPALVEALVDADDDPRLAALSTRIGQDLLRRGADVVICRNQRKNCPDVRSCP